MTLAPTPKTYHEYTAHPDGGNDVLARTVALDFQTAQHELRIMLGNAVWERRQVWIDEHPEPIHCDNFACNERPVFMNADGEYFCEQHGTKKQDEIDGRVAEQVGTVVGWDTDAIAEERERLGLGKQYPYLIEDFCVHQPEAQWSTASGRDDSNEGQF